jgi:hypothetical protein
MQCNGLLLLRLRWKFRKCSCALVSAVLIFSATCQLYKVLGRHTTARDWLCGHTRWSYHAISFIQIKTRGHMRPVLRASDACLPRNYTPWEPQNVGILWRYGYLHRTCTLRHELRPKTFSFHWVARPSFQWPRSMRMHYCQQPNSAARYAMNWGKPPQKVITAFWATFNDSREGQSQDH